MITPGTQGISHGLVSLPGEHLQTDPEDSEHVFLHRTLVTVDPARVEQDDTISHVPPGK